MTGLAAKLGRTGMIGFVVGLYAGFLQVTMDFTDFEASQQ